MTHTANPYSFDDLTRRPLYWSWIKGAADGCCAATWIELDDDRDAMAVLVGIRDGDPAVLDRLPAPDLSGEWAARTTGPELVALVMPADEFTDDQRTDMFTDVCEVYETAFSQIVQDDVQSAAVRYLIG